MDCTSTISGLDSKTLCRDDPLPPLTPGKMRLYNMRFCPYVHRTIIALAHKGIPTEVINVNLVRKPSWLFEKNPLGLVPILEKDEMILYESADCNEYLDQVHPDARLMPSDPKLAEEQRQLADRLYQICSGGLFPLLPSDRMHHKLGSVGQSCERLLTNDYFGGSQMGHADAMSWPWFERYDAIGASMGVEFPDSKSCPKLTAYMQRMKQQPAIIVSARAPELHVKFLQSYAQGRPLYDLGVDC